MTFSLLAIPDTSVELKSRIRAKGQGRRRLCTTREKMKSWQREQGTRTCKRRVSSHVLTKEVQ